MGSSRTKLNTLDTASNFNGLRVRRRTFALHAQAASRRALLTNALFVTGVLVPVIDFAFRCYHFTNSTCPFAAWAFRFHNFVVFGGLRGDRLFQRRGLFSKANGRRNGYVTNFIFSDGLLGIRHVNNSIRAHDFASCHFG